MGIHFEKYLAAVVQAAPVFLNGERTVEKACRLIREAGKRDRDSSSFLRPGSPHFLRQDPQRLGHEATALNAEPFEE